MIGKFYAAIFRLDALNKEIRRRLILTVYFASSVLILLVMRMVLLYMILDWINAPLHIWVFYWCSVPLSIVWESLNGKLQKEQDKINRETDRIVKTSREIGEEFK